MVEAVPVSRDGRAATEYALRQTADGDCAVLGEFGCTIYDHRPHQCRTFDCRVFYAALTRKQRRRGRRQEQLNPEVLDRGAELLGR